MSARPAKRGKGYQQPICQLPTRSLSLATDGETELTELNAALGEEAEGGNDDGDDDETARTAVMTTMAMATMIIGHFDYDMGFVLGVALGVVFSLRRPRR